MGDLQCRWEVNFNLDLTIPLSMFSHPWKPSVSRIAKSDKIPILSYKPNKKKILVLHLRYQQITLKYRIS